MALERHRAGGISPAYMPDRRPRDVLLLGSTAPRRMTLRGELRRLLPPYEGIIYGPPPRPDELRAPPPFYQITEITYLRRVEEEVTANSAIEVTLSVRPEAAPPGALLGAPDAARPARALVARVVALEGDRYLPIYPGLSLDLSCHGVTVNATVTDASSIAGLDRGEQARIELALAEPLSLWRLDEIALRQPGGREIVAAGRVVDLPGSAPVAGPTA